MSDPAKVNTVEHSLSHDPTDDASEADIAELEARINDYNCRQTAIFDARDLSIILLAADGSAYAGLHGFTWGGYCEIKLLWVAEEHRGIGIGSALLASAEEEARRRGCGRIILTTHSFQAPQFYERHGFLRFFEMPDCPAGHSHIGLIKHLGMAD